jgi:hypothetical protein
MRSRLRWIFNRRPNERSGDPVTHNALPFGCIAMSELCQSSAKRAIWEAPGGKLRSEPYCD